MSVDEKLDLLLVKFEQQGKETSEQLSALGQQVTQQILPRLGALEQQGKETSERLNTLEQQGKETSERLSTLEQQGKETSERLSALEQQGKEISTHLAEVDRHGQITFDELMKVEKITLQSKDNISELSTKYDTLLFKADNTALLLKMVNDLQDRVSTIEQKLA